MFYKTFNLRVLFLNNIVRCNGMFRNIKYLNSLLQRNTSSDVTAGILIIGDEILKGKSDVNTPFLIKQLHSVNVKVSKIAIIPDNINAISSEVGVMSSKCAFVITSGGIGPTHDDVTYEAVAKACNDELLLNQDLVKQITTYLGSELENNPGVLKYASIPKSSMITYVDINHKDKTLKFPIVSVRNIYMFPGVPIILQKTFNQFKNRFLVENKVNFSKDIYIDLDEFSIIVILNRAVQKFQRNVKFGSYPTFTDNYYKVKLVLESQYNDYIEDACNFLKENLPKGSIIEIKKL